MKKLFSSFLALFFVFMAYAHEPIKVACVGNSVTFGYLLANPSTDSYPSQLQQMLGDEYVVGNFGHNGATVLVDGHRPYIQQEAYKKALDFRADIVIIHLGLNDTDPRDYPNYGHLFTRDYINLVKTFKKMNPKVRIFIAKMSPITAEHPRFLAGTKEWFRAIQTKIETVAHSVGATLIDFNEPLLTHPELLPDAIHPTKEGAKLLAEEAYKVITGHCGGLQMSPLYADNMVIDFDYPFVVAGKANVAERVEINFNGEKKSVLADKRGNWETTFYDIEKKQGQYLQVSTSEKTLYFKNIKVGKVWLCSGQSNMAFPMKEDINFKKALETATDTDLVFYNLVPRYDTNNAEWSQEALDEVNHLRYFNYQTWQSVSNKTLPNLSAVAYYCGKALRDSLKMPVGIIVNAVGGSPTESWIDRFTLQDSIPQMLTDRFRGNHLAMPWVVERMNKNIAQSRDKRQLHPYCPTYLFDTAIRPLRDYAFSGVLWYQGESNAHNVELHDKLFRSLVTSWRRFFNNIELPFFMVQLPTLNRPSWGEFRYHQYLLNNSISFLGMAVSLDCGDPNNVHPTNKKPIGERLALQVLSYVGYKNDDYKHFKTIRCCGPEPYKAYWEENEAVVAFRYGDGLHTSDGKPLTAFEVADADGVFYPATATITDNKVIVKSDKVKQIYTVRYAYQPYNHANLVNAQNLPAPTFVQTVRAVYATVWCVNKL